MRYLRHWLFVILWAGLIFLLSSIPDLESGLENDLVLRKMAHALEYFMLTLLLFTAFSNHYLQANKKHPPHWLAFGFAFGLALLYAASDEYHQLFVPGRLGSARDVAIDSIGIILASAYLVWRRLFR